MRIFLTGATGFIGSNLVKKLLLDEHEVVCFVRNIQKARKILGPVPELLQTTAFDNHLIDILNKCDAIINLAGEPIIKRWTNKNKKLIYNSRVELTSKLTRCVLACDTPPTIYISSSAVGFYGSRGSEWIKENTPRGKEYLSLLCSEWENKAYPFDESGNLINTRVVILRTGVVLGKGGALSKMVLPFKLGLGGILSRGKQYMPWIHIQDMIEIIIHALSNEEVCGPINCVSPNPVTNYEFTKTMGSVLRRPTIFPVPGFVLKLIFGEASCVLLDSQRVEPRQLIKSKFSWHFEHIKDALRNLLIK
jgi:uncharacterized protein (TIGR01777 family)